MKAKTKTNIQVQIITSLGLYSIVENTNDLHWALIATKYLSITTTAQQKLTRTQTKITLWLCVETFESVEEENIDDTQLCTTKLVCFNPFYYI